MLQHRVVPSTRPCYSIRFASRLSQTSTGSQPVKTTATSDNAESARKPPSIISRLSDRTQSRIRRNSDTEQSSNPHANVATTAYKTSRPQTTSFISARSAQRRDHATEKWFTNVRELDTNNVDQPIDLKSLPAKKRTDSEPPKHHEMRPKTDLNALFASPAVSLRIQTKRELGGDYTSYLPDGYADPYKLPMAYARLVLGRNKHIPLNVQTGALNIIEEAIRGNTARRAI